MGLLLALAVATSALDGLAASLRVTSWNLQPVAADRAGGTNDPLGHAAAALRQINPDVILLQGVADWQMCAQLAQALKPADFNIAICSSFHQQTQTTGNHQVAILSRQKAYFSWSEPWQSPGQTRSPGGFAFAAVQTGNVRLGFFCAQFDSGADPEPTTHQLLGQLDAVRRWEMNRVQNFVVAAAFSGADGVTEQTVRLLEEAGLVDALPRLPERQRITLVPKPGRPGATADYVLVEPGVFPSPRILATAVSDHYPVTCDLELDATKAAVAWTERTRQVELLAQVQAVVNAEKAAGNDSGGSSRSQAMPAPSPGGSPSLATRVANSESAWLIALAGLVLALIALAVALTRNRGRAPAEPLLIPERADSTGATSAAYTVVVAPQSATSSGHESFPQRSAAPPAIHIEPPGTQTQSAAWQERALKAEARAERAQAVVRRGLMPHLRRWLKQKLVRKLATDRAGLLEAQHAATRRAQIVDERLSRIEVQLQQQTRAYERRIEALTCELVAAKEENRELIRARIAEVKLEMEAARARLLAQAETPENAD